MALGLGLAAISPTVWLAAVFVIAVGIGNGLAVVVNSLLVQRGTPDSLRGRAFTLAMSGNYTALLVGMIVGGFLADAVGARWAWGSAAIVTAAAALSGYALARAVRYVPARAPEEPLPATVAAGATARHD
jgi:MFS family permease